MLRSVALAALIALAAFPPNVRAETAVAPVEARVPFAPSGFVGSDGLVHLAYELHVTNFYGDTGPLVPTHLQVFANETRTPLLNLDKAALGAIARPSPKADEILSILPGKRTVFFVWITLPAGTALPRTLRHHIDFDTDKHTVAVLDGADVAVNQQAPPELGPPLRGGRWLAHEGPGAAQSHHWGSLVAVNGALTIPQRFALDLVGVDDTGHAMRPGVRDLSKTRHADWVGYGWDVLAVDDGIVRGVRDGEQEHPPLSPQPEPAALSADGLFGNYVVLELSPGVFASYAHLKRGSVRVKPGERVRRGQRLAQLGQSGNSAAPHLHFQLSNKSTFEGSEGIPYVFDAFDFLGAETEAQLFGQGVPWRATPVERQRMQLPLNDKVIQFPQP